MKPVVFKSRVSIAGGLWTPKLTGDFQEGDPAKTTHTFEGDVAIKELSGRLRMFFANIKLEQRDRMLTDEERGKIKADYDEKIRILKAVRGEDEDEDEEDDSLDNQAALKRKEKYDTELRELIRAEERKPIALPKLYVFMSKKKPKTRMTDIHKAGSRIHTTSNAEGLFGREGTLGDFECSLKDVPDALYYLGLVIVKLPQDAPKTEEPIVYGFVKLQSSRTAKVRTGAALHISKVADSLVKIIAAQNIGEEKVTRKVEDAIKPLHVYREMATKAWQHFLLEPEEQIDCEKVLKMLDFCNIFLVDAQARRIVEAVERKGDGTLGIIEFENFLMAYDVLEQASTDLRILDTYDALKVDVDEVKELIEAIKNPKKGLKDRDKENTAEGDENAGSVSGANSPTATGSQATPRPKVPGTDNDSSTQAPAASGASVTSAVSKEQKKNQNHYFALDYSAFCEALQVMGVRGKSTAELIEAYCVATGCKEKDVVDTYMDLTEYKKAWLKLADLEEEMQVRGLKPEKGMLGAPRNRERLIRAINETEESYFANLAIVSEVIEKVKSDRRQKQDEAKRAANAVKERLMHEAQRFIAIRGQEKRLKVKAENEEKNKRKLEEKKLRVKLQEKQDEARKAKEKEAQEKRVEAEKLMQEEIRKRGLDRVKMTAQAYRVIPHSVYESAPARQNLKYALSVDFSQNQITYLPSKDFFFWMTEAKKVKLSQNRLQTLPDELTAMRNLQILEVSTNQLNHLPSTFGQLTSLQRLDISNNQLETFPDMSGCMNLRHLSAHSNVITTLPPSVASCFRLEFINLSKNQLQELPEDFEYLMNVVHLDVSSNRLTHLPERIGNCVKMTYLDARLNIMSGLPHSFGELKNLEVCNLDDNDIYIHPSRFNNMKTLKKFSMRNNKATGLHTDIGCCANLAYLDLTNNLISSLAPEVGLLDNLQELYLGGNKLGTLPPELGACTSLQKLDIHNNNIMGSLPEKLGLVKTLRELNVSQNNLEYLPRSLVAFTQMEAIFASACRLTRLPDTFHFLDNLQTLDISKNRITSFPRELLQMKTLRTLSVANNHISLLPQEIGGMTFLTDLDLHKNNLRALPVEFTDVLESVPEVNIKDNPWMDLPPRWGRLWSNKLTPDAAFGNDVAASLDFLYSMRAFYNTALDLWQRQGPLFVHHRKGLSEFTESLRKLLPFSWHTGLIPYIEFVYFQAKDSGTFPKWYEQSAVQLQKEADLREFLRPRKEEALRKIDEEMVHKEKVRAARYDVLPVARAVVAEKAYEEQRMNTVVLSALATKAHRETIKTTAVRLEKRANERDLEWDNEASEERERLLAKLSDSLGAVKKKAASMDVKQRRSKR